MPAIELTRSFSLRRTYTYALSISTLIKDIGNTLCGIKKVVNGAFPTIFNPQEVPSGASERVPERKKNFKQVPVCRLMSLWRITTIFFRVRKTNSALCQLRKHKHGKRVCICFLPNRHWSARNKGTWKCSQIKNWKQTVLWNKVNNNWDRRETGTYHGWRVKQWRVREILYRSSNSNLFDGNIQYVWLIYWNLWLRNWSTGTVIKETESTFKRNPLSKRVAKKRRLTTFEEFILTLVRLRQVLIVQDLSDFIAISKYSVSKVWPSMYKRKPRRFLYDRKQASS